MSLIVCSDLLEDYRILDSIDRGTSSNAILFNQTTDSMRSKVVQCTFAISEVVRLIENRRHDEQ